MTEAASLGMRRALPVVVGARAATPAGLGAITALAGLLRLGWSFGSVRTNPYYDAAVRSMGLSWHNFFYGAFEPGASVSIDKTPVDLWVQVASVKLLGFSSLSLRLPEAIASVVAVPLLYALVARLFGRGAGLAAAAALAVLPISVVTGRSDTMDSVMMALLVLAGWLTVRAAQSRSAGSLLAAGAVLGLAFNVKLFQALIAVPPFALLYLLAASGDLRARLRRLVAAGVVLVGVGLAWVTVAGIAPLSARPYPVGSTNGGVWNVIFAFNGIDRLRVAPTAQAAALDPAGPARLLTAHGVHYGSLIGTELIAALILGALAVVAGMRAGGPRRLVMAGAVAVGLWLVAGTVLFSAMGRLHPRYLEAFTPAVAAALGASLVALATGAARRPGAAAALAVGTTLSVGIGLGFARATPVTVAVASVAVIATVVGSALLAAGRASRVGPGLAPTVAVLALVAVLAAPLASAAHLSSVHASNAGRAGAMPDSQVAALSRFLTSHRGRARYEVVSSSVTKVAPLIVHDVQPVLMLTSLYGRPLTSPARLAAAVRAGEARYALLGRGHCGRRPNAVPVCAPAARWARRHGTDISRLVGMPRGNLYALHPTPVLR